MHCLIHSVQLSRQLPNFFVSSPCFRTLWKVQSAFFYTFLHIHPVQMQIVCERCLQNQSKSELELIFKINLLSSNFITVSRVYTDVSNMLSTCFTKFVTVFLFLICWKQKISYPSVVSKIKECFLKIFINMLSSVLFSLCFWSTLFSF